MSLMCLSTVFQAIIFALFFHEKLTMKMVVGILTVLSGIAIISFEKPKTTTHHSNEMIIYSDEEK